MAFDDTATVSGSVVSIENGADEVGAKSCVVTVRPTLSGVSSVSEKHTGKNLFDKSAVTANTWIIVNSTETEPTNSYSTSDYIPVKANTRYYVSFKDSNRSAYYDKNMNGIAYFPFNGNASFTALYDGYIRITIKNDIDLDTFIVNEGNTVVPYEPFGTTYTASLGRTIYGGQADIVNGQGTESYGRIIFDGSNDEFWQKHGSIASWFYIDNAITDGYVNNAENDFMICNLGTQAKYASVAQLSNGQFAFGRPSPTTYRFVFKNTDFTEVADFKAWLSNNNMQVVYKLATPTYFTFDGQEIPTRLGYNAFWSEQGDTELTYYKSGYGFTSVTVNKTGRNLLPDTNYKSSNFSVADDGTVSQITTSASYAWSYANSIFKTNLPAGTYTAIEELLTDSTNASHGVQVFNSSNNMIGRVSSGAKTAGTYSATFTLTQATDIGIVCKLYDGTAKLYIVSGSTVHAYEPYEAVTKTAKLHKVIYGGKADVIRGTCEPKNLFDSADASHTFTSASNTQYNMGTISLKGGVTYTFSAKQEDDLTSNTRNTLVIYDNGTYEYEYGTGTNYHNQSGVHSIQYTPNADTTVSLIIWVHTPSNDVTYSEFQVEKGSLASDYVPHFEPFTFPPISMGTDEGENTLFANEGDSAITYRKAVD